MAVPKAWLQSYECSNMAKIAIFQVFFSLEIDDQSQHILYCLIALCKGYKTCFNSWPRFPWVKGEKVEKCEKRKKYHFWPKFFFDNTYLLTRYKKMLKSLKSILREIFKKGIKNPVRKDWALVCLRISVALIPRHVLLTFDYYWLNIRPGNVSTVIGLTGYN